MLPLRSKSNADDAAAVYLVSIVGSAGGFQALKRFLAATSPSIGAAIVAMLHTGPSSDLAHSLSGASKLPLERAARGTLLRPGRAYVPPGASHLVINPDACISVSNTPGRGIFRPSGDWLFESAAASFGDRHVCIVLSGMLYDGARQLDKVRRSGGTVLVQHPRTALYPEMPNAAIATGCVHGVMDVESMPELLEHLFASRNERADRQGWEDPFSPPPELDAPGLAACVA